MPFDYALKHASDLCVLEADFQETRRAGEV
jgi:hypothetical protein